MQERVYPRRAMQTHFLWKWVWLARLEKTRKALVVIEKLTMTHSTSIHNAPAVHIMHNVSSY